MPIRGEGNGGRRREGGEKRFPERAARVGGWEFQGETCKSTSRLKRPEVIARVLRRADPRYHRLISRHLVAAEDFAHRDPELIVRRELRNRYFLIKSILN